MNIIVDHVDQKVDEKNIADNRKKEMLTSLQAFSIYFVITIHFTHRY